ncbi:SCO family protein [Halobacteriaceae archaeon GCM10025711]
MNRRDYLASLTAVGTASTAGCLGPLSGVIGGGSDTYLGKPDNQRARSADLPWPAYGQDLPEVTLTAPLSGQEITTTQFDDKFVAMTFFYSHCTTVCPFLISALRDMQAQAANEGYSDDIVFLPVTFDPERDDEERLREYAEQENVDLDIGNWHFLRPDDKEHAKQVVADTFGVGFWRTHPEGMNMYMFDHRALVLLANDDAVVERAYSGNDPPTQRLIDNVETMRSRR